MTVDPKLRPLADWRCGELASQVLITQQVSCLPHGVKKVAMWPTRSEGSARRAKEVVEVRFDDTLRSHSIRGLVAGLEGIAGMVQVCRHSVVPGPAGARPRARRLPGEW